MFEAEELCPELAVLSKGRIVAHDTIPGLRTRVGGDRTIEVEAYGFDDREVEDLRSLPGRLEGRERGVRATDPVTLRIRTTATTPEAVTARLPGHPELTVRERRTSVEDVYLDLVEEEAS